MYPQSAAYSAEEFAAKTRLGGGDDRPARRRRDRLPGGLVARGARGGAGDRRRRSGLSPRLHHRGRLGRGGGGLRGAGALGDPGGRVGTRRSPRRCGSSSASSRWRRSARRRRRRTATSTRRRDPEFVPSQEDEGVRVEIDEFSRSVLQVTVGHARRRPEVPAIEVFVTHLKSKLATPLDDPEYRDPRLRPHGAALGTAHLDDPPDRRGGGAQDHRRRGDARRTTGRRWCSATSTTGTFSDVLAVLSGQPSFRVVAASTAGARSDAGLYTGVQLQQLRSLGDVYYTHEYRNVREVIDHVLVSEQFYDWSDKPALGVQGDALLQRPRAGRGPDAAPTTGRWWRGSTGSRGGGQWVSVSEKALTMTTPATMSAEAEHRRRIEALAEQRPADRRDQHDAGAGPDRVGDAHRDGLEGEGEPGDGAGVEDRDNEGRAEAGELLARRAAPRCR